MPAEMSRPRAKPLSYALCNLTSELSESCLSTKPFNVQTINTVDV